MGQSPVKVSKRTKDRIRLAAAVSGRTQTEILDAAVDEYIARHEKEFSTALKRAGASLLDGHEAEVAYLIGMSSAH